MLYQFCLFSAIKYIIIMKDHMHSMKHMKHIYLWWNYPMALCELVAQYNIYVVMGLLYTGVQKIESVDHAVTLSAKPFKCVTQ